MGDSAAALLVGVGRSVSSVRMKHLSALRRSLQMAVMSGRAIAQAATRKKESTDGWEE